MRFSTIFNKKNSTWAPYEQAKTVLEKFSFSQKNLCTRTRDFRTLRSNIFSKIKKFANAFLPVHIGPRSNVLSKIKMVANLVTLSLNGPENAKYGCQYFLSMLRVRVKQ